MRCDRFSLLQTNSVFILHRFTYTDEDLIFIRFLITHKDQSLCSRNDDFALAPLLLDNLADGWRLVKLLDLDGRATDSTLLVHVERS